MIWPFNLIVDNKILTSRVRDLERSLEILTGENNILRQELDRAKEKEDHHLEKIFSIAGLNKQQDVRVEQRVMSPIGNHANWPRLKNRLETKSREDAREVKQKEEYWKQKEAGGIVGDPNLEKDIEILEKEVMGDAS